MTTTELELVLQRLNRIEERLVELAEQRRTKEWYSTTELAKILGKAEFTVREWCRLGRVNAEKRASGRGNTLEWIVSHDELTRIQNHGLLAQKVKW